MSRIVLIDGSNILQKAFYNVPIMTDATGLHTNAVFGFVNILLVYSQRHLKSKVLF